jgi:hypothetical protein
MRGVTARAGRVLASLTSGLLAVSVLAACGSDGGADDDAALERQREICASSARALVVTTQRYLDSFGAPAGEPAEPEGDQPLTEAEYDAAVDDLQAFAASSGCDPPEFEEQVRQGLEEVTAPTALARAILLQLRVGEARGAPRTAPAEPGDDLAELAATLPNGSTIELTAGTYELDDPLLLLRGVTLRGVSRDATVLSSSSAQGVLLVLTGAATAVEGVELRRTGDAPGAVVLAGPSARLTLTDVRVTGARAEQEGAGGAGILLAPSQEELATGPQRPTTLRLVRGELVGNESAGLVVTAGHRAEIEATTIAGAGQCGICFLATSDGLLTGSTLTDNVVGVLVVGTARPALTGNTVRGGEVAVQLGEQAEPVVQDNDLTGSARAAVIASDRARGRVDANRCSGLPVGIVVGPEALPFVGENADCVVARGVSE